MEEDEIRTDQGCQKLLSENCEVKSVDDEVHKNERDLPTNNEKSNSNAKTENKTSLGTERADDSDNDYHSASDGECEKAEEDDEKKEIVDDEDYRRKMEDTLTEEEKQKRKEDAQQLKEEGNQFFRKCEYKEAISCYSRALDICPLVYQKERAVMFSNRAACYMKEENFSEAITDCTHAIDLHPHYLKAILRRAELYQKSDKLDDALKDHQRVVELDPGQHASREACMRLTEEINVRNEKLKEEMIGKLKELGNMVLRPFGLSTNNFQMQKDPNTGSYSVQFLQNPPTNGK
ncbi:tetratricopeptide repeat protein 1-like [Pomacea canaliculata]|uniref:tetratricopeptide repeat protein 1-like n=1 Tax=Pomacea canaliculata TaxID=400727 RepID=UPI000D7337E1|nr:tetratricopeptide repeat protein 1-like [Pomacea canaliculata]